MSTYTSPTYGSGAAVDAALNLAVSSVQPSVLNSHDHIGGDGAAITEAAITLADNTTNNASTTKHGFEPKATAPASGLRSVLAIDNGETVRADKALFDATNPAAPGAAAPGSAMTAARRDHVHPLPAVAILFNASVANQGAGFATDTYITGSEILMPETRLQAKTCYELTFNVTKTAAGTATPIITLRTGANASTADTARCTFTFTAGTAAADEGVVHVYAVFRSVGAGSAAVLQGLAQITHRLSVTGLTGTNAVSEPEVATSSGFDSTVANTYIGVSVNGGASAAWTVNLVQARLFNLTA